jgi:hypothetical protein
MTTTGKQWIRVDLWHTTIALAVQGGSVVWVPPAARWALGKPERAVADHYRREGAQFTRL